MKYVCSKCGHEEEIQTLKVKCDCGGLWKLDFQPPKLSRDLIDQDTWSIFRYRKFMTLPDESWRQVTLGEGMTPIVPLDEDVLVKMDYYMPTLSFKDRGAAVSATIPEDKILAAREALSRRGIYAEHTTAAVYAGYLHYCEEHGRTRDALISMCGAGLKSDH
ncbi:hypothetical protein SAMN04487861_12259 [Selenomonas ruminantium]|uniref:Threonine synthase n=1 Tax=Selenomonas ruminantium TaxID=971 RepID=A0A1I3GIJ1_SELRU|nr:hypothetical protein [Selenomonas ruminantium]SFI23286.1 hypothetical protein SAMN04487861_12259 [Selenomonas ruminantium]